MYCGQTVQDRSRVWGSKLNTGNAAKRRQIEQNFVLESVAFLVIITKLITIDDKRHSEARLDCLPAKMGVVRFGQNDRRRGVLFAVL